MVSRLTRTIAHKGTLIFRPRHIDGFKMSESSVMHPGTLARMGFGIRCAVIDILTSEPIKHSHKTPIERIVHVPSSLDITNTRLITSNSNYALKISLKVDATAAFFPIAIAGWIGFGWLVLGRFICLRLRFGVGLNRRF